MKKLKDPFDVPSHLSVPPTIKKTYSGEKNVTEVVWSWKRHIRFLIQIMWKQKKLDPYWICTSISLRGIILVSWKLVSWQLKRKLVPWQSRGFRDQIKYANELKTPFISMKSPSWSPHDSIYPSVFFLYVKKLKMCVKKIGFLCVKMRIFPWKILKSTREKAIFCVKIS